MVNGKQYEEYIDTDIRGNESRQWMSSEFADTDVAVLEDEYKQQSAQEAAENAKRIEAEAARQVILDEVMFAIRDMRDAGTTIQAVKDELAGFEAESYFRELAIAIAENNESKFARELNNI